MSFKDLENEIRRRVEAAQAAARKIAERRAYKAKRTELNKKKAARPPMYRPDAPPKYTKVVVLNVRKIRGPELGELEEREYRVSTVSEDIAELEAKRLAKEEGFSWRGTVDIRQGI